MPDLNAIPWTTAELIDYAALVAATVMVCAFPVVYGILANLKDRLALVVVVSTSLTALAFLLTAVLWPLSHTGWIIPDPLAHGLARVVYLSVGLGKVLLLVTFLRERRHAE